MITLPQTTALRLPRPVTSLAIPTAAPQGGVIANNQSQSLSSMTGGDVWRVIRSNLWLIILMVFLGAGAGYGANYWLLKYVPRYTSKATLIVYPPTITSSDNTERSGFDIATLLLEVRTHAALLKNPSLFSEVLQNSDNNIRGTPWFKSFDSDIARAKADLDDHLDVTMYQDSRLIGVSMTGSDAKSCKDVLKAIVDQYIKDQQARNNDRFTARNVELANRQTLENNQISGLDLTISDLEAELNANGVTGISTRISEKDIELTRLFDEKDLRQTELDLAQQKYANFGKMVDQNQDPPELAMAIAADPQVSSYQALERQVRFQLDEAMQSGNAGGDNPEVIRLQGQMKLVEQSLASARSDVETRGKVAMLESLKDQVDNATNEIDRIDKRIGADQSNMAQIRDKMAKLMLAQAEKDRHEVKLRTINEQIDEIAASTSSRTAGLDWFAPPETPDIPSFPRLPITMTVAVALGLCLALSLAFLRELMDTSIRSPRDISRVGNMNLLGMVPHEDDDPQSAGARLPVVIFEAPHSMMAEQLRQVRTRLQHSSSLDTTRSILVTSPSPADGKSTIACNLASGLALNGRRILLVDANFRRPELHRIFNLSNEQGFSDVLNSLDLFEHAVQETQVPNLFILPSGPKPTNATELIESQLLVDFIERALEEFDHVIFDSGPLLFVSETVALAPRVDGVISVVRARTNTRGVLSRMRETLRQVKAEHLGVVLNAVRAQGGGYYGRNIRTYYEYQNGGGSGRAA